jgi:hypothetical protein
MRVSQSTRPKCIGLDSAEIKKSKPGRGRPGLLGFQLAGGDQLNNVRYIMYKTPYLSTLF